MLFTFLLHVYLVSTFVLKLDKKSGTEGIHKLEVISYILFSGFA